MYAVHNAGLRFAKTQPTQIRPWALSGRRLGYSEANPSGTDS